ncbi:hypothetical protein NDU88_004937 [Pleurodeles waltl]|uniref:Uncharacterized protein n=1 Tax=Pleurodeles waltl TaxID=8319 RepID=A0AAV7MBF8_PLEWA|nr:hypothetical protein NDU88_004937 [Pleurodeles waltl]
MQQRRYNKSRNTKYANPSPVSKKRNEYPAHHTYVLDLPGFFFDGLLRMTFGLYMSGPHVVPVSFSLPSPVFFTSRLPLPASFFPRPVCASVPEVATLLLKRGGSIIGSPGPAVFGVTTGLLRSRIQRRSARPEGGLRGSSVSVLSIRPVLSVSKLWVIPAPTPDLLLGKGRNPCFNHRQVPWGRQRTNERAVHSVSFREKNGSVRTSSRSVWVGSERPITALNMA